MDYTLDIGAVTRDPRPLLRRGPGLNLTALNAEAHRVSIQAVPRDHLDAGIALGIHPMQRILNTVLPQALRDSVPVLLTNGIGTFQQSALVVDKGMLRKLAV